MGVSISKNLYEEHFGLLEFPFGITPNPRFSYNHSPYREAFATLRYGIEARKGFTLIIGEVGTGKTTLLRTFMRSVESTVHPAFIFNPKLTFSQLVRSILTELGVACSSQDRFTLIEKLNDYLIEQFKKDHIVALLVDEAQDLNDEMLEELRLLSNLETDSSGLIQIVLTGQPEFERRLDQPELRQLKQRIALRCRLTPLPSGEVGSYIHHRLRKAGYQGKELFEAKAVETISLTSQGIPRLINVICDNALLIAYASSKKTVSAEMIEEVARDLELTVLSDTQRKGSVVKDLQRPRVRDEVRRADMQEEPVSEEFFMEGQPPELYPKRAAKRVGLKIFLGLFLMTGISAVIYSQQKRDFVSDIVARVEEFSAQSKDYLSHLPVTANEYFPQGTNYLSALVATMGAHFQRTSDSVFEVAIKIGDYFHEKSDYLSQMPAKMRDSLQPGWDYLSGLAVKARSSIAAQWEELKHVNLIPETSQGSRPDIGLQSGEITERAKEPELNKAAATVPEAKKIAERQTPKTPATADERVASAARDDPKQQPLQPDRQITPKREPQSFLGNFEVFQDSFLRDKPQSDAAITTLPPGTQVKVESKSGRYLRVRSLNDPELHGYVHVEDAFFEPIR